MGVSSMIERRRFLKLAALTAASTVVSACGGGGTAPPATQAPAGQAASQAPTPTAAPAAAPTPTTAPITVSQAQPTAAPTATVTKYNEAPMLADLVKQGKLPPVEQRLPTNPRVITPLEEVGQYGGTWHRAYRGLSDRWGPTKLLEEQLIEWDAPDPNTIRLVPNFVEKWEQSDDATEFTFHFRKGVKWSDGTPVSMDDVKFWLEDVQLNKDLVPEPSFLIRQKVGDEYKIATVSIVDDTTVTIKYPAPNPLLPIQIAKNGGGMPGGPGLLAPSHYLKKFHPKYADKATLDQEVSKRKLSSWTDLWGKAGDMQGPIAFWFLNPELPVLYAWKIDKPTPADPVVMVRNPYYWQVDTQGNQLPYIDRIEHAFFDNFEVLKLWVASGKIDAQMRHMDPGSYTFFKENEKKGGYRVFNWRQASTDCYYLNINCPDPVLAKLFDTPEFRHALNIAVNRKEINELVWNGLGRPRQYSPVRGSPEYDEGMETAWTEYDPQKANDLLDKLGLTKGADGVRKRPDGKPLEIIVEYTDTQGSPMIDAHNLLKKYWDAIGVRTILKYVERSLYEQHVHNGDVQSSSWGFDRSSVVKADPGRWLGTIDDGPWAPLFGHWYAKSPYKQQEPPADHPIRQIWQLWEKTQAEPDEAKRNAYFQQLIGIHKQHPYAVGVVGEKPQPFIVKENFRNVKDGFIQDDTLRDYGLINPQQFFIKQ
jgi:peptide/nickel transport system substrate-binding protein